MKTYVKGVVLGITLLSGRDDFVVVLVRAFDYMIKVKLKFGPAVTLSGWPVESAEQLGLWVTGKILEIKTDYETDGVATWAVFTLAQPGSKNYDDYTTISMIEDDNEPIPLEHSGFGSGGERVLPPGSSPRGVHPGEGPKLDGPVFAGE